MNSRTEYRYDDKTGVYIGEQTNTLTYRDKDFYPLPWCVLEKPNPPAAKIAVINTDKTAWTYKDDVSGTWYDTATGAEVMLTAADYERDTSAMTRSKPGELQKWNGSAWVDDLDAVKSAKRAEITAAFESSFLNGSFLSTTLGIEVDCRRSGTKNDEQNVRGLISRMTRDGIKTVKYKGKTESATATLAQIQSLQYEMEDYGASLYAKKWAAEDALANAQSMEEIEKIAW